MKQFKLLVSLLLAAVLLTALALSVNAATVLDSGEFGENVNYTFDSDGVLTLSGTGATYNPVDSLDTPWSEYRQNIKKLVVEEGITELGVLICWDIESLEEVEISSTVQVISNLTIMECPNIRRFTVDSRSTYFCTDSRGVLYTKDMKTLYFYPGGAEETTYTIPASVKSIRADALTETHNVKKFSVASGNSYFSADSNGVLYQYKTILVRCPAGSELKSFTTSSTVTSINSSAFAKCRNLESVTVTGNVKTLGRYSFDECRNLVNLTLSEGIETIDYGAFMYCNSLLDVTIPEGVKKINNQIFDNANLRSITLPSTLPEISSRAFSYASPTVVYNNSDTVLVPGDNQLGGVAKDAAKVVNKGVATYKDGYVEENDFIFDNWGNLCAYVGKDTSVTLPLTYKGEVCDISSFTGATHVTVPEGFETLPSNAFAASEIKSVKLPNSLKVIDSSAFSSCKNLTEITIPSGVTTIKSYAFYGCEALKQINIPDSVTKISSYAFQDCTSLTDVYIGKGLTSLGSSVFSGCNKLVNLIISDENESLVIYDGLLYSKDKTKLLYCPTTVTQVSIPEEVTYISSNAFSGCTKLTSIKLPNVKTIDFDAFINCISLTKVEIGSKLRNLYSAFNGCMSLKSIDIDENNPYYCSENGIVYNKEKTNAVFFCPQTTNATIPMTVSKIDFDSLRSCQNLSLTIDGENPYFTTNDGLVYNGDTTKLLFCPSNKASVTIPEGVVTMDVAVFANNNALTDVKLPNTLETISSLAFQGCGSLKEITIPDSVETISNNAFAYSGLEKINFGNGLKYIDYGAFESCRHLSKVVLPDGLETISNHAFIVCSNLSSITIPDSVTSIGEDVFNYCDDLTIRCTPGSYAETYAKNNNIRYSDSKVEPGDINGDGIVDLKDVTTLRRYLAGGYGSTIEDAAADVNGDNAIDLKDVTTLRRFLAGGYGVELK